MLTMEEESVMPTMERMEVERQEEPIGKECATRLLRRREADRRRRAVETPRTAQVQGGVVVLFLE